MTKRKKIACGIVIFFVFLIGAIYFINGKREANRRILCASCLRSMGLALKQYSMDFGGCFPNLNGAEGFEQLRSNDYLNDYKMYCCPSTDKKLPAGYSGPLLEDYVGFIYRGGLTENDSPDSAVIWDKPDNHKDYGNVLFLNGKVKRFYGKDWMRNID